MENEPPWSPLAIMFSMYGSRISSKLLFKYPFETGRYSQSSLLSYKQLTSSTYHLNLSTSSPGNKTNEQPEDETDDEDVMRDEVEQYLGFSDETLAQISCPGNSKICGQKFDVKINGLRVVGFPLMLEHRNIYSSTVHSQNSRLKMHQSHLNSQDLNNTTQQAQDGSDITIMSFNVVFVLKTTADYSVVEAYQHLAAKLGIGLRFEEKQAGYVTKETRSMLNIHDEDSELLKEQIYQKILEKSLLAQNLRSVFDSLEDTGVIDISLNDNFRISFCLYQKVHNEYNITENCNAVKIKCIEACLNRIQPFHGLLVYEIKDVWASLTDYCSMSVVRFLSIYKPTKSFRILSVDADIALKHVYSIARHLVVWGKACIIYPLCETNVYVLAPTASLYNHSKWIKLFGDKFQLNLTEVLSYFSTPVRLGDYQSPTGPFYGNEKKLVDILIWMLQHRFLVQHHTYVYFFPPHDNPTSANQSNIDIKKCLLDVHGEHSANGVEFHHLPKMCRNALHSVHAAHTSSDLTLFLRLLKYFDGKHHLEEMMYRENMMRLELMNVLDKFKPVLLTCIKEDEIASAFCMPT